MDKHDILFCTSVFRSAPSALRLARTASFVPGKNMVALATPSMAEAEYMASNLHGIQTDTVVFYSKIDCMYFCRAIGFLYAIKKNMKFRYMCSCDDDIEFTPNSSVLLDRLNRVDFSIMTFGNIGQHYESRGDGRREDGLIYDTNWINGDSMFTHFDDNILYGVADSFVYPKPSFTECEYQHRMRVMTGKPMVTDIARVDYYFHHYIDDPAKTEIRTQTSGADMGNGNKFFEQKYSTSGVDFNHAHTHTRLLDIARQNPDCLKRHFIFDGLWNDWKSILDKYEPMYELVGSNI